MCQVAGDILQRGGLQGIEGIHCVIAHEPVLKAVAQGACPGIRKLYLDNVQGASVSDTEEVMELLAKAMSSSHYQNLKELELKTFSGYFTTIAEPLKAGACPQLDRFVAYHCVDCPEDCEALVNVLESGAFSNLKELGMGFPYHCGDMPLTACNQCIAERGLS